MTTSKGQTKPRQFRLTDEELAILDKIAATKQAEDGVKRSRADAIRMAARHYANAIGILPPKTDSTICQTGE